MEGIVVEISNHPTAGDANGNYKRKVEVTGLLVDFKSEVIALETVCTYYENIAEAYGNPVSIPQPIKFTKRLTAITNGEKVVWVTALAGDTYAAGDAVVRKTIIIDGDSEERWVLKSDEVTEVPAAQVMKLFDFLVVILKTQPIVLEQIMTQFVVDEVPLGTYDKV